ncbi:MAG: hypothetical protein DRN49_00105 [Thaumarchaeota archaeon]|nr:MAG: hypothetical protein DRN49_00105 [Nitrososphaerota archaeon]
MFRGQIDSRILKNWLKAIKAVTNEFRMEIQKENGWLVTAINEANTALVEISLQRDAFDKYETKKNFAIALDCDLLENVLKDARENIELEITKEKLIAITNKTRFEIRLLSPEGIRKPPASLELDLKTKVYLYTEDLRRGLQAAERVSRWNEVVLSVKDNCFFVKSVGESEVMEMILSTDDLIKLEGENCRSMFSLVFLMPMIKAVNTKSLQLGIGTDEPVKITWEDENMSVMYLLAPRVSDDWNGA